MKARARIFLCLLLMLPCYELFSQPYNDGPIELRIRVREFQTSLGSSDASFGFSPDDFTMKVWARDDMGSGWQGGQCLTSDFDPAGISSDLNTQIFYATYGASTPQVFDLRLDAWEDDIPADQVAGFCSNGTRCAFDCCNTCCGIILFGNCVGVREEDDNHCDANPFRTGLDYRLGPPCQWYNHGYVSGGCGNDYMPRIESYWRYLNGENCSNAIDIGTLNPGGTLRHYNSTACYNNDYGDPGNDVVVRFTITQAMGVRISLCGGATFNTTLFLLDASCNQLYSNQDGPCPPQSQINANLCSPGNYFVVIDGSTTAEQGVFNLTVTEDLTLAINPNISSVNVSCNGLSNGSASASVTGGTSPYQYLWTPGNSTSSSISGLAAGTYIVRITDARSCVVYDTVVITQPNVLEIQTIIGYDPICNGESTGEISVPLVTGGTAPYQYSVTGFFQPTSAFTALAAGTYTATVMDGQGCSDTASVTLTDPPMIKGNLTATPETCDRFSDGTITPNPSLGTPPYYCSLDFSPVFGQCTGVYTNLPARIHYVTIRDANGCEVTEPVEVPLIPTLTITLFSKKNVSCHGGNDGEIRVSGSRGTPPLVFSIDGEATFQSDSVFTGLTANLYTVIIQDANGCKNSLNVQVDEPTPLLPYELFQFSVTCNGKDDGLMVITASGGTGPYLYSLDSINFYQSGAFKDLAGGTYHFIVKDNNNCVASFDAVMHEPAVLEVNIASSTNASCNGIDDGTLMLGATGGTPPFKFSLNNGPFQAGAIFSGLAPGDYLIGVEDRNGCVGFDSASIGANVSLTATVSKQDVLCHDGSTGSITITSPSGTAPHQYSINNIIFQPTGNFTALAAGNYTAIVRDATGCQYVEPVDILEPPSLTVSVDSVVDASCAGVSDGSIYITSSGGTGNYTYSWSNSFQTEDIINVTGGNYSVIVKDGNNCTTTVSAAVNQSNEIFTEITRIEDVSCYGESDGYVDVDVFGGVPPFSYRWSDNSATRDLFNVPGGTYFLTVTDASGCEVYDTAAVLEPSAITSSITATSVSCASSAEADIDLEVSGGTPPYDYLWSNFVFTQDQTDVPAGTYTVIITDDNGCTHTDRVTISAAAGLSATFNTIDVSCFGKTDGQIEIVMSGGTAPYNYNWSNNQNTALITSLGPGIYDVTVTDATACSGEFSEVVKEPEELKVNVSSTDVLCYGDRSGLAIPFVTGGTGENTFLWNTNPPSTNPVQTSLPGGTFILEVRDEKNCPAWDTVTINEPAPLTVTIAGLDNIICLSGTDGEVTVKAAGGVPPYRYSVRANRFQADSVFTGLEAGDYGVMVIDDKGCMATNSFTLTESAGFSVNLPPYIFVALGASDTIKPEIIMTEPIGSYEWKPSDFLSCAYCREPVVTPLEDRSYTLVVTDSSGCKATDEVTVVVKTDYDVFMPNVFSPNGDGVNDVYEPIDYGSVRMGTMKIFNRWGALIYETSDIHAGWDGTFKGEKLTPAVFIYHITGEFLDGSTFDETGSVTLIR